MEERAIRVKAGYRDAAGDRTNLGQLAPSLFALAINDETSISLSPDEITFGIYHGQPRQAVRSDLQRHLSWFLGFGFWPWRHWPPRCRLQCGLRKLAFQRNLDPRQMIVLLTVRLKDHKRRGLARPHIRNHAKHFIRRRTEFALGGYYRAVFVYIDTMKPCGLPVVGGE